VCGVCLPTTILTYGTYLHAVALCAVCGVWCVPYLLTYGTILTYGTYLHAVTLTRTLKIQHMSP
jgi:hypothetical protein